MKPLLWLLHSTFGCNHRQISRVFSIKERTYPGLRPVWARIRVFLGFDAIRTVECCFQFLCVPIDQAGRAEVPAI